jgi:hypothetical protein
MLLVNTGSEQETDLALDFRYSRDVWIMNEAMAFVTIRRELPTCRPTRKVDSDYEKQTRTF